MDLEGIEGGSEAKDSIKGLDDLVNLGPHVGNYLKTICTPKYPTIQKQQNFCVISQSEGFNLQMLRLDRPEKDIDLKSSPEGARKVSAPKPEKSNPENYFDQTYLSDSLVASVTTSGTIKIFSVSSGGFELKKIQKIENGRDDVLDDRIEEFGSIEALEIEKGLYIVSVWSNTRLNWDSENTSKMVIFEYNEPENELSWLDSIDLLPKKLGILNACSIISPKGQNQSNLPKSPNNLDSPNTAFIVGLTHEPLSKMLVIGVDLAGKVIVKDSVLVVKVGICNPVRLNQLEIVPSDEEKDGEQTPKEASKADKTENSFFKEFENLKKNEENGDYLRPSLCLAASDANGRVIGIAFDLNQQ